MIKHTNIIKTSAEGICVEFNKKKTTQLWFFYFQIAIKY